MTKRNFCLRMLVMVLALGMLVIGCDNGSTDNLKTDSRLNGTWIGDNKSTEGIEIKLIDGNFFQSIDEVPWGKGTYSITNDIITIKPTHMYGPEYGLESKWYSKNELEMGLKSTEEFTNDEIIEILTIFAEIIFIYSINGNTLTFIMGNEPLIYSKQ